MTDVANAFVESTGRSVCEAAEKNPEWCLAPGEYQAWMESEASKVDAKPDSVLVFRRNLRSKTRSICNWFVAYRDDDGEITVLATALSAIRSLPHLADALKKCMEST